MPLPSCFNILNDGYFSNISLEIDGVVTSGELQSLVNRVFAEISLLESTITSQISFLAPVEALLTAPGANLSEVVTWITSLINDFITPILKPYTIYTSQLAQLAIQVTTLTAAINSIASAKFPGITITIPPISINCSL